MAAYCRVYDSRHLPQADCQEPGSAPEPYLNFYIAVQSKASKLTTASRSMPAPSTHVRTDGQTTWKYKAYDPVPSTGWEEAWQLLRAFNIKILKLLMSRRLTVRDQMSSWRATVDELHTGFSPSSCHILLSVNAFLFLWVNKKTKK